jgi:cyclohexyl-isocyanide hydratase
VTAKADGSAEVVASVCTGSLLLAAAGPLQGHRATTHWAYHRFLNRLGAAYVPQRRVQDGRYLTGAGCRPVSTRRCGWRPS